MNPTLIDPATNREISTAYEIRLLGWTEEQFWAEAPEGRFCEFVDGEVIMPSPVDVDHQRIVGTLLFLLKGFCGRRGVGTVLSGPTAIRLRPGLAREPDLFVLARADGLRATGSRIEACPFLVIEVAGHDSERRDLVDKVSEYQAHGVQEYWVVLYQRKQVFQFRAGASGGDPVPTVSTAGRIVSVALPGFWIDADWLWSSSEVDGIERLKAVLGVETL